MACLDGDPALQLGVAQNDSSANLGSLDIAFNAKGRTRYKYDVEKNKTNELVFSRGQAEWNEEHERFCFCDCMKYRQFIKGKAWLDGKPLPEVKSGNVTRKLNGAWQQEDVSTTVNTQNTCARMQHDEPGVTGGIPAGSQLDLRYNFLLQIWDTCRETSVWMEHRALTIRGTSQSAIVRWATGELPLTQSSINRAV